MTTSSPIRVLCVDDHPIVRDGIELILGRHSDMRTVGSAGTIDEALQLCRTVHPHVALMDLRLGATLSIEAIRTIRREHQHTRVIVLSVSHCEEDVAAALAAGATTYLFKETLSTDLVRTIREVAAGETPVRAELEIVLREHRSHQTLTPRERDVMKLIAEGRTNSQIAAALNISELTVQVHVKNIFSKLSVCDRTNAVHLALRRGIIHID